MKWITIFFAIFALAGLAQADTLNTKLADAGNSSSSFHKGSTLYHYTAVDESVSLDFAVPIRACPGGLDIGFNADFDGTDTDALYTLYDCPRATASANFGTECLLLRFDHDGGGLDGAVMGDATNGEMTQIWGVLPTGGWFGATLDNTPATADQAQVTLFCVP